MIDCATAVEQMWDYVEGRIEPVRRRTMEEHLDFCRRCCGEVEFAEEMRRFMRRRPTVTLPAPVAARFERLLEDMERSDWEPGDLETDGGGKERAR